MARDMSDKEILKMELEQLKKEVDTPRTAVSQLTLHTRIPCIINNPEA
jgi:hypothetical protein